MDVVYVLGAVQETEHAYAGSQPTKAYSLKNPLNISESLRSRSVCGRGLIQCSVCRTEHECMYHNVATKKQRQSNHMRLHSNRWSGFV